LWLANYNESYPSCYTTSYQQTDYGKTEKCEKKKDFFGEVFFKIDLGLDSTCIQVDALGHTPTLF